MADVKQRAEAEAEKKGLSGAQEQAYVGGVFNRIRQAHARATTPGTHGARRLLKRAARREARAEAQEQIRYHEQQIAGLKEGIHLRARLDEPRKKVEGKAATPKKAATREEQIAEAGGYVPKTPIMELRKKRPRQLTDEQLERDWQSAANWPVQSAGVERRKAALEREMARRREAQAAPVKPADRAYWAKEDRRMGLRPGTVEALGSHGFYVLEPFERGHPWTIYRDDGKVFHGITEPGAGGGESSGVRAVASPSEVEQFARMVQERPDEITPSSRKAQEALMLAHTREGHTSLPAQPAQPAAAARPAKKVAPGAERSAGDDDERASTLAT